MRRGRGRPGEREGAGCCDMIDSVSCAEGGVQERTVGVCSGRAQQRSRAGEGDYSPRPTLTLL